MIPSTYYYGQWWKRAIDFLPFFRSTFHAHHPIRWSSTFHLVHPSIDPYPFMHPAQTTVTFLCLCPVWLLFFWWPHQTTATTTAACQCMINGSLQISIIVSMTNPFYIRHWIKNSANNNNNKSMALLNARHGQTQLWRLSCVVMSVGERRKTRLASHSHLRKGRTRTSLTVTFN